MKPTEEKVRERNWDELNQLIEKIEGLDDVRALKKLALELAGNLYTAKEHIVDWKYIFRFKEN